MRFGSILHKVELFLLLTLCLLLVLSYHPDFYGSVAGEKGTVLTKYIVAIFGVLVLLNVRNSRFLSCGFNKGTVLLFFWVLGTALSLSCIGFFNMMSDVRTLLITVMAVFVGWSFKWTKTDLLLFVLAFSVSCIVVSFVQIFTNGAGLVIMQGYFFEAKNQLGAMAASAFLSMAYFGLFFNKEKRFSFLFGLSALLLLVAVTTLRARTSLLTSLFLVIYIVFKRVKSYDNYVVVTVCVFVTMVLSLVLLPYDVKQYFYDSIFKGFDEGNLVSGRMDRNVAAVEYLRDNLLFGQILNNGDVHQIHNYLLNKLYNYGLVFVLPIVCMYVHFLINCIKGCYKISNGNDVYPLGYLLLAFLFIGSFVEPAMPFGPGTASAFNFILYGVALKWRFGNEDLNNIV